MTTKRYPVRSHSLWKKLQTLIRSFFQEGLKIKQKKYIFYVTPRRPNVFACCIKNQRIRSQKNASGIRDVQITM